MKGQKRKRGNGDDAEIGQGLAGKLHHALATLARAAKKAKTFEIQKLVRKIKGAASATGTGTDVSTQKGKPITASQLLELEGVLVALKSLQVEHLASHALRTRLAKDKTGLGANEDVVLFCSHLQEASSNAIDPTIAEGKAQNRVLASKAMADALNDILVNLRKKAGISIVAKSKQSNDKAASAAGSTKDVKGKGKAVAVEHIPAKKSARQSRHASEASTSVSDDGDETSSSEDDLDSDDGDESDATVSHISAEDAPPGADEEFSGFSDNNNDDDDDDNVSIASDSSFPVAAPKKSKKAKEPDSLPASSRKLDKKAKAALDRAPPPTTSAFLPSLAGGYTVGDPDGSVYSYSGDEGPAAIKPERKNRRGQRARQAIWEKKYGKTANHVVKKRKMEEETEENRRKTRAEKEIEALKKSGRYIYGLDSNLTSVAPGKQQRSWAAPVEGAAEAASGIAENVGGGNKVMKKPPVGGQGGGLHPSWEARKKAKELQASLSTAKPAGKKIVFD